MTSSPHPSDKPIPVTRVITWLPVGGIERRLVSVLPRLADKGFAPRLLCIREEGPLAQELRDAGVPVDLIALRTRLDPFGIRRMAAALRTHGTRVLHSHMYRSNVPGTLAGRLARVPVVFGQVHNVGTWETPRQRAMDRFLCRWRTGMICVSRAVQRDVRDNLGLPEDATPVLYNGCDTDRFRPDEALRAATRDALGIAPGQLAALVPARLHSQKNPLHTAEAFARALGHLGASSATPVLLFAGGGPMEDALRDRVAQLGLAENVRLLGKRDDMTALYNAADVMVLSTAKEGFSNAVVEALACGKPVIAADVGGNAEALTPEVGWLHEAGDTEALASQLAEAFAGPEALARRAAACRDRGLRFSLDRLVEETAALYRRALDAAGE
ncbi:MAG: glycosyltransferase [Sumerlaeia bacterium]